MKALCGGGIAHSMFRRQTVKIGRPGYQVTKSKDHSTAQRTLHFTIHYPEIEEGLQPRHRFMSAYEQKKEVSPRSPSSPPTPTLLEV